MARFALLVFAVALLVFAVALLAPPANAAEPAVRQFANVVYTVPDGMKKGRTSPGHVVLYHDDDAGTTIRIYRGVDLPRDTGTWLQTFAQADVDDDERDEARFEFQDPAVVRVGRTDVTLLAAAKQPGGFARFYVGMPVGGRLEVVRFETRVRGPDDAERLTRVTRSIEPFLHTLRFVSLGEQPLAGTPTPGPLDGIFMSSSLTSSPSSGGLVMNESWYVFTRNGRFLDSVDHGTDDPAATTDLRPDAGGHYTLERDTLTLRFADGETDTLEFALDGEGLELDGRAHDRVPPVADGTRLDGTWSSLSSFSTNPYGGGTNTTTVSAGRHLTLRPDGTYERGGWHAASGNFETGDTRTGFAGHGERPLERGTYAVEDGRLHLKPDGGDPTSHNLLLVGDALLYLDGTRLLDRTKNDD